ncbi:MAG: class I SAM-dependent methyltransferase [Bdellovibrionaceae bacterium]|nr:class I SAM-dependent methyltransferase [Pseudobdellovibrionaceae bacterium]MDW8189537.1 class I SAM-dependent methyltransferase [Pseudobdellovibrionaceae bacterium]
MKQTPFLQFFNDDIAVTDKPKGISTHAPAPNQPGWLEYCQESLGVSLWVTHRLDKETSGLVLFARNPQAAETIRQEFILNRVKKVYWLITDRSPDFHHPVTVKGNIEKKGKTFIFTPHPSGNSETLFIPIKRNALFQLWEAQPLTGKTHQIRLHAAHLGIPILGDVLYGGSSFPTLCLHAKNLNVLNLRFESHPPIFFERMGLLYHKDLIKILIDLDQRQRLFGFLKNRKVACRASYWNEDNFTFILDILGEVVWIHCYPTLPKEVSLFQRKIEFLQHLIQRPIVAQEKPNLGQGNTSSATHEFAPIPENWEIEENNYKMLMKKNTGKHYGLFLDQRRTRKYISDHAHDKEVLNLFSYTGGFTLAALKGGARQVTQVDLSRKHLNWSQENLSLNGLVDSKGKIISIHDDAMGFLKNTSPKRYHLIVCDPPVFSRLQNGRVFRLNKELPTLIQLCLRKLHPSGTLIFSTNYEEWSEFEVANKLQKIVPDSFEVIPFLQDLDTLWIPHGRSKIFIIKKRTSEGRSH